jgi:hypothetical protein
VAPQVPVLVLLAFEEHLVAKDEDLWQHLSPQLVHLAGLVGAKDAPEC